MTDVTSDSGPFDLNLLGLTYWEKRWKEQKIGWHREKVSDLLDMYHPEMMVKEGGRVFFPLCGKTVDMRYMAERGYEVIGLEYMKSAIMSFFSEQKIPYSMTGLPDKFILFESMDKNLKIKIYNGDFFRVTPALFGCDEDGKQFDGIWDRASLVAINPCERHEYARIMSPLITSQTRYMIAALSYDQSKHGGPPFSTPLKVVRELFGEDCNIEEKYEAPNDYSMNRFKLDWWLDSLYLLIRK